MDDAVLRRLAPADAHGGFSGFDERGRNCALRRLHSAGALRRGPRRGVASGRYARVRARTDLQGFRRKGDRSRRADDLLLSARALLRRFRHPSDPATRAAPVGDRRRSLLAAAGRDAGAACLVDARAIYAARGPGLLLFPRQFAGRGFQREPADQTGWVLLPEPVAAIAEPDGSRARVAPRLLAAHLFWRAQ